MSPGAVNRPDTGRVGELRHDRVAAVYGAR